MIWQARLCLLTAGLGIPAYAQTLSFPVVSAASFDRNASLAPQMIVTGFTTAIPDVRASAGGAQLSLTLGGFAVSVRDSAGTSRDAGLIAVARGQISFVIPSGTAAGNASIVLRRGTETVASGAALVARVSPGFFTANSSGDGAPAGFAVHVEPSGRQTLLNLFESFAGRPRFEPRPFELEREDADTYLVLFGTGIRGAAAGAVRATIADINIPVQAAQAQAEFAGLDQVNLGPLPRGLAGRRGLAELQITVDGIAANRLMLAPTYPPSGGWGRRSDLIEANSEMSVTGLDGRIYVLGGYPSSRVTVATVQAYDARTDEWRRTTPLPTAVNHAMPAVFGGKLYLIGGQTDAGSAYTDIVQEFDPATEQWRARAPMPTRRSSGAAATIDGKIYVAGGRPPRGADFAVYDPAADQWQTLPDLPTQRNHLAAAAINGKLYVVGGRFEGGFTSQGSDSVEIYDPKTGAWSTGAPMPKPRGGVNAVEAYGCLHVFGGEFATGVHPDHDVYNPVTNTWTSLDRMPIPVHGVTGLVFLDGLIYLPGGGIQQGGSSGSRFHQVYRPGVVCQ